MDILLILAIFAALCLLQALLIALLAPRGFGYARRFSVSDASCGDKVEFIEVIRNRAPLLLPWVRMEARVPASFEFHTREEVEIRGENYHKSVFTLMPYSQITRRHQVVLRARGHYQLTQASMTAGDLLGFKLLARDIQAPASIYVYPALLNVDALPLPFSRPQGDAPVPRWIQPDPFLVNGIRDYRPGDPQRDIHWAATARMGALQVKTHDYTADPRLMVLINAQNTEDQWGDLMDYEQDRIEYAISLAATLCLRALRAGCEAGFAANIPLDESEDSACLLPARGAGRAQQLLRAFASLRIRRTRTFPTFVEQLPPLSGADIVILSCYDSPTLQRRMEEMRRLGNTVSLYVLPKEVPHA